MWQFGWTVVISVHHDCQRSLTKLSMITVAEAGRAFSGIACFLRNFYRICCTQKSNLDIVQYGGCSPLGPRLWPIRWHTPKSSSQLALSNAHPPSNLNPNIQQSNTMPQHLNWIPTSVSVMNYAQKLKQTISPIQLIPIKIKSSH